MALLQPKVQEIAKDLKLTSTEIIEALTEMGYTVKNSSVQLDDEQLGIIFDIFTKMYDMGDEPIVKPPRAPKPAKKEAPKEVKKEEKPEVKKEEKKPAEKAEKAPEKKAEKKPSAPKAPPAPLKKKKEEAVRVAEELSDVDLFITPEQKSRYVDTRTSTVELETIETRERLADMVEERRHKVHSDDRSKHKKNKQQGKDKFVKL